MENWLSIPQLSKETGIPETTVRRYTGKFSFYFQSQQMGRGKKYHPEAVQLLLQISKLYDSDYTTDEVKDILSGKTSEIASASELNQTTIPPSAANDEELQDFIKKQKDINKKLLALIHDQNEMIKQLASKQKKKWWQLFK